MQERRKIQRNNLMAYTQVFDLSGGYLIGYLGDLNLSGAMVIGDKPMAENTQITLAIELPDLINFNKRRLIIPARVAWNEPDISPEFFAIGFEFKKVTIAQNRVIETIMKDYEFRHKAPNYTIKPLA
jgi:hypothetical protein